MSSQPRYRKGDRIGGRYLVHQALMGGMGEVYLCLDLEQNYPYALKTFQVRYLTNPHIRQLFTHEVGTWVALEKHPNIVRCFYMDILDNQPFMVLEWVAAEEGRGTDLRSWLRHGPLDLRTALDVTIDICRGLIHAQAKQPGIVHRDLKPDNILVSQGRQAKITDFGLATLVQQAGLELAPEANTGTGQQTMVGASGIVGTPPYMAPEQWRGEPVDVRTDVYAVGCVLYELLTGQLPYRATTLTDLRRQHEQAPLPALPQSSLLPFAFNALLANCLAKRSTERFATVEALLQSLTTLYQYALGIEPRRMPAAGEFIAADYTNRGITYHLLGHLDAALADHAHAIQLDPADAKAYNNRGNTYADMRRFEEALADYTRAIALDLIYDKAYYNRGVAYAELQRFEEALADYDRAIELNPTDRDTYIRRGLAHKTRGSLEAALADYTRAIQLDPTLASAYYNRGNILDELDRFEDALTDFSRVVALDPLFSQAYVNRGAIYNQLGRSEDALANYNRAIELDSADALAYRNRGNTYAELGQTDAAIVDYDRAIQLDPADTAVHFNRGALLANQGQLHAALPSLEQAARLGHPQGKTYAEQIRTALREGDAVQKASNAFQNADSRSAMQHVVAQHSLLTDPEFVAVLEGVIREQVPPMQRAAYEQRLAWLREIAGVQQ